MGLLDGLYRVGEPALGLLSGAVAEPVAGWAGLLGGGAEGVQRTRNALTYQPRTQAGKEGQNALARLLLDGKSAMVDNNPPVRMAVDGFNALADRAGEYNPLMGAAMKTVPAALGLLAGPGSQVSRNALAEAVKGTGRTLGPKAAEMMENHLLRTGGILPIFAGEGSATANRGLLAEARALQAQGVADPEIYAKTGWFSGMPDGKWRYEIPDNAVPSRMQLRESELFAYPDVSQAYPHKELFAAYPETAQIKLAPMLGDANGSFDPSQNVISLRPIDAGDNMLHASRDRHSTAMHELQHAVQTREGFAAGGSPELMQRGEYQSAVQDLIGRLEAQMDAARDAGDRRLYNRLSDQRASLMRSDGYGAYKNLAGEAEARLVQKRLDMTPEERAASYPPSMFDVPVDQQIVRFGTGEAKSLPPEVFRSLIEKKQRGEPLTIAERVALQNHLSDTVTGGLLGQKPPQPPAQR